MSRVWCAILFAGLVAACCGDESAQYDTIVVGAGAAGCSAASALGAAGRRVLLLDAQDRIGGRVWTRNFGDGIVETGAEWIHGTVDSRTYELAQQNHVELTDQTLRVEVLWADGSRPSAEVTDIANKAMQIVLEAEGNGTLAEIVERDLRDYINFTHPDLATDETLFRQLLDFVEASACSYEAAYNLSDVNGNSAYKNLGGSQNMSWGRRGYRTLFDILLKKYNNGPGLPTVDIKLNTEVTSIAWPRSAEQRVVVSCGDTNYTADHVIVTVSLGVLKGRQSALFSPPLPAEKQDAIDKITMGTIGKIIFSFEKPWWRSTGVWYGFLWKKEEVDAVPSAQRWVTTVSGVSQPAGSDNTLTLWTWGHNCELVEKLPEDEVKTQAMSLLRRFMSANTTIPDPTGMIRTTWHSNPFTLGTYSYDGMSQASLPNAREILAQPITDDAGTPRVLFAGEASHSTRFGTVHGATETGQREAARLLGKMK